MPYSRLTHTSNGANAISYCLYGRRKKTTINMEKRNCIVDEVNMLPCTVIPYSNQMRSLWAHASSRNKNQVIRLILSFSKNELDPSDKTAWNQAADIARQLVNEAYPNRQALICVQNDGRGGCLHIHIIVNNVDFIHHKGCTDAQKSHTYLRAHVDRIVSERLFPDKYSLTSERATRTERIKREKNQYVWKDDLKSRIKQAMLSSKNREDFIEKLAQQGVRGEYRISKNQGEYLLYELMDTSNFTVNVEKIPGNLRSKSYKLGADYDIGMLDQIIAKSEKTSSVPSQKNVPKSISVPSPIKPDIHIKSQLDVPSRTDTDIDIGDDIDKVSQRLQGSNVTSGIIIKGGEKIKMKIKKDIMRKPSNANSTQNAETSEIKLPSVKYPYDCETMKLMGQIALAQQAFGNIDEATDDSDWDPDGILGLFYRSKKKKT